MLKISLGSNLNQDGLPGLRLPRGEGARLLGAQPAKACGGTALGSGPAGRLWVPGQAGTSVGRSWGLPR